MTRLLVSLGALAGALWLLSRSSGGAAAAPNLYSAALTPKPEKTPKLTAPVPVAPVSPAAPVPVGAIPGAAPLVPLAPIRTDFTPAELERTEREETLSAMRELGYEYASHVGEFLQA